MTIARKQNKIALTDEAATIRLAARVAGAAKPGDVLALSGDLGSGKTVFARAFINARSTEPEEVPSPTFTLVQEYQFPPDIAVYHFDLFRIENADETLELGIDEAFRDSISLIEWPERIAGRLPDDRLEIVLTQGDDAGARQADLLGMGSWGPRLEKILVQGAVGD
ncbi:MAG: tRNA (adenosine(37)-N6)-threonylcarbamoyltransferase complex ATPase subunit type 1 TsaE [Proteobacteria bacterium]|nr:tRNA (adenosine(37)-N6)-threonylcarbamoyltransferase complex ATPase subunit type 1 TsaE [Pseudomonadota bacterium]MDA1022104.1 tRNA (adenosine(37)-N6)-threonylcarbamoyltransferase complex ATPase subunit type 1 TsaE [Pseudomonadota bacterium]